MSAGHEGEVFEEVLGMEEGAKLLLAVGGRDLPEALADQITRGHIFVEGLVVAAQMLGEGVRHDLVHIHTDALHGRLLRGSPLLNYCILPAAFSSKTFETTAVSDVAGRCEQNPMPT